MEGRGQTQEAVQVSQVNRKVPSLIERGRAPCWSEGFIFVPPLTMSSSSDEASLLQAHVLEWEVVFL